MKTRKAYNSFQTKNGKTYKLMGTFVDPENSKYSDLILLENNDIYLLRFNEWLISSHYLASNDRPIDE